MKIPMRFIPFITMTALFACHGHPQKIATPADLKARINGRLDLALYSSFTVRNGVPVLWYPERKFFLLGRIIPK